MIYALFIAFCVTVFLLVAAAAAYEWVADKWADYQDRARDAVSAPEALRDIPDPTWDRPFSERDRLREIPLQRQPGVES